MDRTEILEKLKADNEKFSSKNYTPSAWNKILDSWLKMHPSDYIDYIEILFSNICSLSYSLVQRIPYKDNIFFPKNQLSSEEKHSLYFSYLNSLKMDETQLGYFFMKEHIDIFTRKTGVDLSDDLICEKDKFVIYFQNRIKKVKSYDVLTVSVGDHEHDNQKDRNYYCSLDSKSLEAAINSTQQKISFDYLNMIRNRNCFKHEEYKKLESELREKLKFINARNSIIEDLNEIDEILFAFAKFSRPDLDYCRIEKENLLYVWTHNY